MTVERKPVAFGDLRGWLQAPDRAGELQTIDAEVDWNIEPAPRRAWPKGRAPGRRCCSTRSATMARTPLPAGVRRRAVELSPHRHDVRAAARHPSARTGQLGRTVLTGASRRHRQDRAGEKKIAKGDDVDSDDFPAPQWNRADGGATSHPRWRRHQAPQHRRHEVGVYRGTVAGKNMIPMLTWRAQHIGQHATAWQQLGHTEMPIAVAIGWEPSLDFVGGAPVPKNLCEYDVIGAIRGVPVELVNVRPSISTCRPAPRSSSRVS